MEKAQLLTWENKCIQEEAPECTASCPLHVDARLFVRELARGDGAAAFKVLAKTMPFPGILGRICDHPCESRCKRGAAGEAIAIGALERACVTAHGGPRRVMPLPRKDQRIAVLGSGLAGLTAAYDLLKKGLRVTLIEPAEALGGRLRELPEERLPRAVLDQELAVLSALKVDPRLGEPVDAARFAELHNEFDALFVDREMLAAAGLPLAAGEDGRIAVAVQSGACAPAGVFAGGGSALSGDYAPVIDCFEGRRGALSIERHLQQAQMAAGREQEGPYPTRLFTSIEGIEPRPRVAAAAADYSPEEARQEAERCLQCECMECVKVCLYLERYQGYPRQYARKVFNNERVIFGAPRSANQFINSCSNCGLCEAVCPNDFHVGELCLQARREMVEAQLMPASFHEFALQDLAHASGADFALGRHQPGHQSSAWLYFPSCQLCATAPGEVLNSYGYLQEQLSGGVGILLGCCGAPAYWAGREELFCDQLAQLRRQWQELGRPKLITACVTCQSLFAEHLPELEAVSLWELLEKTGLPPGSLRAAVGTKVAIADPCMSRNLPQLQQSVRRIAQALGLAVEELPLSGEKAECCGYGGLMFNANPGLAAEVVEKRAGVTPPVASAKPFRPPKGWQRQALLEGQDTAYYQAEAADYDYLAYCALCRDRFAAAGARVSHLVEQLFPNVEGADPAARGWISWSERRTNRARVKAAILRAHGETVAQAEQVMQLIMSDEVRRRIDARRILEEDLVATIAQAEASGQRLVHEDGYFRACHRPGNVTFWVDYEKAGAGYRVLGAYCHRMRIVGVKS